MINNLQSLYKADFSQLPETVIRDLESTEEVQQLRRDIKTLVPGSNWSTLRARLLTELEQLLDIELSPILVASWQTHQDVEREIRAQKGSGGEEIAIVNLEDHEIRSTHSPQLIISIADRTHTLRSFIGITLNMRGVALLIQQGEIREILSGTVKGHGFMQYQNATLIERDFLDFDISGKLGTSSDMTATSNEQKHPRIPVPEQPALPEPEPVPAPQQQASSLSSNMLQFVLGISIALIAVYLFWQFI